MKTTLELFAVVDSCGDFAVGKTAEEAREKYEEDIGPLNEAEGFRLVKLSVAVPLPVAIEAAAEIIDDEPASLAAA